MVNPKFLILTGDGINCEKETALALDRSKFDTKIIHINDLLSNKAILNEFQGMAIPGGFSFGDELGSGQLLALKIKNGLIEEFKSFVEAKKPIIGICNGFQVLVKLGVLPCFKSERTFGLAQNDHGRFIDKWVKLSLEESISPWVSYIDQKEIQMPVRHGEGRVVFENGKEEEFYNELVKNKQVVFRYAEDINGSYENIAGVCDPSGLILGMMPHPEAAYFKATNKKSTNQSIHEKDDGSFLFDSIRKYFEEK